MANWHQIWKDSISANSAMKRSPNYGETCFEELIKKYGEDGMIFFEWGWAYDTMKKKDLALEKFKIAKEKLPLEHWKERAQYGIDKIEGNSLEKYPKQIKAMCELHSYLYSEMLQEQEIKYLLISYLPNVETETASTLIYFRVALESFLDVVAKSASIRLNYKLVDDIKLICIKLPVFNKIKDEMDRTRRAGNVKVHVKPSYEDIKLAEDINDRIDDFLKIVKFYKSESEVSKLLHK